MALVKQVLAADTPIGIDLDSAYHKIGSIMCRPDNTVELSVLVYANQTARTDGKSPVFSKSYELPNFDFNNDHCIKKILYAHLKTLPVYEGAVDA